MKSELVWDFEEVTAYFSKKEPKVALLMAQHGPLKLEFGGDPFESLVTSILSQQISVAAADSIKSRLKAACGKSISPRKIVQLSDEELRSCGVSPQKQKYLKDLSEHFIQDNKKFQKITSMSDEEVIHTLTEIKGIGRWTAQMFLIFNLGRQNVFAPDDLGLQVALQRLYRWRDRPDKIKAARKAARYAPYASVVSRYLWVSLNNKTTP